MGAYKEIFTIQQLGNNISDLVKIEDQLLAVLKKTIQKQDLHNKDRVNLVIMHNNLNTPLSTGLIKVNKLDKIIVGSIGNTVEYKEFPLSEAEITIETIKLP